VVPEISNPPLRTSKTPVVVVSEEPVDTVKVAPLPTESFVLALPFKVTPDATLIVAVEVIFRLRSLPMVRELFAIVPRVEAVVTDKVVPPVAPFRITVAVPDVLLGVLITIADS
jgi:hypothetical protein